MSQTEKNLYNAFVGESKAALRLKAFAEKADKEGYPQMASLFRAISAAEEVHALKNLRLLKVVQSTDENLQSSFDREMSVSENEYRPMIQAAEEEGDNGAAKSFSQARDAEASHAELYKKALNHLVDETETEYHVCQVCGYVADGQAPETCPVCGVSKDHFKLVS